MWVYCRVERRKLFWSPCRNQEISALGRSWLCVWHDLSSVVAPTAQATLASSDPRLDRLLGRLVHRGSFSPPFLLLLRGNWTSQEIVLYHFSFIALIWLQYGLPYAQFEVPREYASEWGERREGRGYTAQSWDPWVLVERQPSPRWELTVLYWIFSLGFQPGKVSTDNIVNHFLMGYVVSTGNGNENPCREKLRELDT